jgi:hypothetical protein
MLKNTILACAVALGIAVPARAELRPLPAEVVGYESPHRNTAGVIVGDAVGGAIVGGLVGGGVAAYRNYVQNDGWGNWQRDVLVGAGIGLGIGLIIGIADVASSDRTFMGPVADRREVGFDAPMANKTLLHF